MKTASQLAQQARQKAGRALLKGADCGVIQVEGKSVKVKLLPSGVIVGVGPDSGFRLNPENTIPAE